MITNGWVHFAPGNRNTYAFHFAENFKNLKEVIKTWVVDKRNRDARELQLVEVELSVIYDQEGGGLLNQVDKDVLKRLEGWRITL